MAPKNIVILGAGVAGVDLAHHLLQKVLPTLPKDTYHIYLVDRADQYYNRVPSPRTISNPDLIPSSELFRPYNTLFSRYSSGDFTFVQAEITGLEVDTRTVALKTPSGNTTSLSYHSLIIATGLSFDSPLWGIQTSVRDTQAALRTMNASLKTAKSVLIAGGGPVGVETAGEIGEELNGRAGWFSRFMAPKTKVVLYSGAKQLLPVMRPAIATQAEKYLEQVGVEVVHQVRVQETREVIDPKDGRSRTEVVLSNGEKQVVDVYICATGAKPSTGWAPKELLDARGRIQVDQTLRVSADVAGPRVYVAGDVGSHSIGGIANVNPAIGLVAANLKSDLLAESANEKGTATGSDRVWKLVHPETQLVPVGRSKGVGAVFGWKVPSWFVWLVKGRNFMTGMVWNRMSGN